MQFDDFINRVQELAKLATKEESTTMTRAVLETLGERLDRKVCNGVASQLPNELKDYFLVRSNTTDQYGLAEFYNRVGARADLKYQEAVTYTRQVLTVLRQAIPQGEIQDILEDLPSEYQALFKEEMPNPRH